MFQFLFFVFRWYCPRYQQKQVTDLQIFLEQTCPNLDKNSIWLTNPFHFYENYKNLYFDAKHLNSGLNRGSSNLWCSIFQKKYPFWKILYPALIFLIRPWQSTKSPYCNNYIWKILWLQKPISLTCQAVQK